MGRVELPAELQHKLVWMVAAALRHYIVQQHQVAAVDAAIEETASALIAAYDEGATLEARAVRLARRLHAAGRIDGDAARPQPFRRHAALLHRRRRGALRARLCRRLGGARRSARARPGLAAARRRHRPRAPPPRILLLLNSRGQLVSGAEGDAAAEQLELYDTLDDDAARDVLRLWQAASRPIAPASPASRPARARRPRRHERRRREQRRRR